MGYKLRLLGVFGLILLGLTGCGSNGENSEQNPPDPIVFSGIILDAEILDVNAGDRFQLTAQKLFSDGSRESFYNSMDVTWTSDRMIVTVNFGLGETVDLHAQRRGESDVVATYIDQDTNITYTAVAKIRVHPVFMGSFIEPDYVEMPLDFVASFRVIDKYNDNINEDITELSEWTVNDTNLGEVGNVTGIKGAFLALNAGDVTLTASYQGRSANANINIKPVKPIGEASIIFEPPNSLMKEPRIDVTSGNLTTALYGYQSSGEVMVAGHDGVDWVDRTQINPTTMDGMYDKAIDSNENGARFVIWDGLFGLYAVYAAPLSDFGRVMTVPTDILPNFDYFQTIDATAVTQHEVLVLWTGQGKAYLSRYEISNNTWAPAELIYDGYIVKAAFNENGDAVIISAEGDNTEGRYYAAIYKNEIGPGGGLQPRYLLDTLRPANYFEYTNIAINKNRDLIIGWIRTDGFWDPRLAYLTHYTEADGWQPKELLKMGTVTSAHSLKVSISETGIAIVAWHGYESIASMYTNVYTPIDGWSKPTIISTNSLAGSNAEIKAIKIMDSGNAICVFEGQQRLFQPYSYTRYIHGVGWGETQWIDYVGVIGDVNDSLVVDYNNQGYGAMSWQEASGIPAPSGGMYMASYNFLAIAPRVEE